ncbi:MAG: putative endopeptidase [Cryomorphaceae bacterium]|jgi:putative endopeptidase
MKKLAVSAFCLAILSACGGSPNSDQAAVAVEVEKAQVLVSGIDMSRVDSSVRPQDDLFRHVSGIWLNEFEIPADKSNYGSFTSLADKAREDVKAIIEQASAGEAPKGSDAQKVGDLYKSFMNEALLDEIGNTPLAEEFAKIDAVANASDLSDYIAYAQIVSDAPFYVYVYIDEKQPDTHVTLMGQSGLGLPNRDFYLKEDDKSKEIRSQYTAHVAKMAELAGLENGQTVADTVISIETQLAEKQWAKETLRDPVAGYNKNSSTELAALLPAVDWDRWRKTAMLEKMTDVIVAQPDYLQAVNLMLTEVPLDSWKQYFKWHLITAVAPYMNAALDQENFSFYRGVLSGVKEQEPRWKRGVSTINNVLGEVVGKIYVSKHFTPEAKAEMNILVENLRTAYGEGINGLEWMGEETKKQALDKLSKFTPKIGYPDKWKDYSALEISADDLMGNMKRATIVENKRNRDKLGQPIDRNEWFMNPQTVNAYYNPVMNEIVFPAAILQPPFFNLDADVAVNYGGIGAVIGHEMGHGFDDSGSQYDGDGKLSDWWTEEDRAEFEKRSGKLIAQYNRFTVLDGVAVNGEFTQGENIGDLSGLTIAFKAYQSTKENGEAPVIDGLTGDQRVFAGWAQVWARKYRDEELRKRIETDPHSPSEFRANGTVMNMPEFYQAFNVKPEDKMYADPEARVKIW